MSPGCDIFLDTFRRFLLVSTFVAIAVTLGFGPAAAGPDLLEEAKALNQKGIQFYQQRDYQKAAEAFTHSLAIREKALGPDHRDVATSLNNLAELRAQGRYSDAEPLYKRSLAIREKALGPDHPDVATGLNNLAANPLANAKALFIVPDGALQSLPPSVLVTEEPRGAIASVADYKSVPWLIRRHALTMLPSMLARGRSSSRIGR